MVEKWDLGFYFSSESQWLEGRKTLEPQDTQKETRAGGTGPHLLAREKESSGLRPLHKFSCDSSGWLLQPSCLGRTPQPFFISLSSSNSPTQHLMHFPCQVLFGNIPMTSFLRGAWKAHLAPRGEGMMNL